MNSVKSVALLGLLTGLLTLSGYLLTGDAVGAAIGLLLAGGLNFTAWFYSDRIALQAYGAKRPNQTQTALLQPIVERLCQRAGLPIPRIYVIATPAANAFATGRDPEHGAIAVTEGLIQLLSLDQLEGVIAHELSHIKHRDTLTQSIAATLAGGVTLVADLLGRGMWLWGGSRRSPLELAGVTLSILLAPIAAIILQMALSRTREFAADAGAAELTGNPQALAQALERLTQSSRQPFPGATAFAPLLIVSPFSRQSLFHLLSTHPAPEARIEQLRNMQLTSLQRSKSRTPVRWLVIAAIAAGAVGLLHLTLVRGGRQVVVVGGTELQEPLQALEAAFEQAHPTIDLKLEFQGSQDAIDNVLDGKNDFTPAVLIPANGDLLTALGDRWRQQNGDQPFDDAPRPLAKTHLVAIAWADRGAALFPDGQFEWQRLEQAIAAGSWAAIGGPPDWGSFDLMLTDPSRSNSGQLALSLWVQAKLGALSGAAIHDSQTARLFRLVKRSVYQPPRSTDILLQEFIARGANEADVAIAYESVALHRWQQSTATQGKPYRIYPIAPSFETVATAAVMRVDKRTAQAAHQFIDFLTQPEQQAVFVRYGFRPVSDAIDLEAVADSPWQRSVPGASTLPPPVLARPDRTTLTEILRLWEQH